MISLAREELSDDFIDERYELFVAKRNNGRRILINFFTKQTVAKKLHGTDVDMEIVKTKSECDHVQFLITDTSGPGVVSNPMIAELETLSVGE